ncbi:MAG: DUF420 domain-containing protein [Halanaeroarchaeum sp.]
MARTPPSESWAASHPRVVTATVSLVGYVAVAASFLGIVPFPRLSTGMVNLFSDLIAVVNSVALVTLLVGVAMIRRGRVQDHRRAMIAAFGLILVFLFLYVWKQAGGFTKGIVVQQGQFLAGYANLVEVVYLAMLAIHVVLSVVAVPFVLHAVVLGLTQPIDRLPATLHPTVGKVAVATWATSLFLGILTYLMLNHVYSWERIQAAALPLVALARPRWT